MRETPVITDWNSSPWFKNNKLLASAKSRVESDEWRWRKIINMQKNIREERVQYNHPDQPWTQEFRDLEEVDNKKRKQMKEEAARKKKKQAEKA